MRIKDYDRETVIRLFLPKSHVTTQYICTPNHSHVFWISLVSLTCNLLINVSLNAFVNCLIFSPL